MARPSQPLITRDEAVRVALSIIDAEGVDSLSAEKIATALGVKAPSLYHHFRNKSEILAQVAKRITFDVEIPNDPRGDDWISWFVELGTRFRRSVLAHPRAAPLLVTHFPRRFTLSSYERGAKILQRAGVPVHLHAMIYEGLDKLTFGSALFTAMKVIEGDEDLFPGLDPERDPALLLAVEANRWGDEELFQKSMRSFLHGAVTIGWPE